jgi:predicted nucleotide-binding protein
MNRMKRVACLAGFALMAGTLSQAQLADKKALTLQIAKQVVAAAEQAAVANHNHMFIVSSLSFTFI